MLSKDLELTLNRAYKNAQEKRHEFMTVEHLLLKLKFLVKIITKKMAQGGGLYALTEQRKQITIVVVTSATNLLLYNLILERLIK